MFDDNNLIYVLTMDIIQNIKNYNILIYKINNNSIEYLDIKKKGNIDSSIENEEYKINCNNNSIIIFRDPLHNEIKMNRNYRLVELEPYIFPILQYLINFIDDSFSNDRDYFIM